MRTTYAEAIRERAYQLWQAAGQPQGNPDQFWIEAERLVPAEQRLAALIEDGGEAPYRDSNDSSTRQHGTAPRD